MKRISISFAIAVTFVLLAATVGSGSITSARSSASHKKGGTVTISNTMGETWNCHFNPFNPGDYNQTVGYVYEPLVFVNTLNNAAETPMLASSYKWSANKKNITFTIRRGVKWNDGSPFTAQDVAFTFKLMKQHPSIDAFGLWTRAGLRAISAVGSKVTFAFAQPAQIYFFEFASQVGIVPRHIFSTGDAAAHPDTWADTHPVGTGPFMVNPCSSNNIQYVANPNYWKPGEPYIQKVEYPAYLDNGPANLDLANSKAQWGNQYIPNIKEFYLSKSKDHHTWNPVTNNLSIFPNLDPSHKATSTLAVRKAIALALNRTQISVIGEQSQVPPANQTAVVLPTFKKYFNSAALTAFGYSEPNPVKAKQLLATAGYSPSHPLNLTIITITGYTDWDANLAVIKQQLQPIGINLKVDDLENQTYNAKLASGDFDLAYNNSQERGPTPYYEMRYTLDSSNTAPIGKLAAGNWERYKNPVVDALFARYATASPSKQVSIIKQISNYVMKDVPIIPTVGYGSWYQYDTSDLLGWPTQANPYAQPGPYTVPDNEQVLLRLWSKSAQK